MYQPWLENISEEKGVFWSVLGRIFRPFWKKKKKGFTHWKKRLADCFTDWLCENTGKTGNQAWAKWRRWETQEPKKV